MMRRDDFFALALLVFFVWLGNLWRNGHDPHGVYLTWAVFGIVGLGLWALGQVGRRRHA